MLDPATLKLNLKKNIEDVQLATPKPLIYETKPVKRSYKSIKELINAKK